MRKENGNLNEGRLSGCRSLFWPHRASASESGGGSRAVNCVGTASGFVRRLPSRLLCANYQRYRLRLDVVPRQFHFKRAFLIGLEKLAATVGA